MYFMIPFIFFPPFHNTQAYIHNRCACKSFSAQMLRMQLMSIIIRSFSKKSIVQFPIKISFILCES